MAGALQQKHNSSAVEYFFQNLSTECKRRQMKGLKQAADNAGKVQSLYHNTYAHENTNTGDTVAEQTAVLR